jgi:hypothetical protein
MQLRKQRWVIWWLGGVVVVSLIGWWMVPEEPSHANRSLTSWLDAMAETSPETTERVAVEAAFRAMGSNAVPALLRHLQATEAPWKTWVRVRFPGAGSGWVAGSTVLWRRSMAAAQALRLLGDTASQDVVDVTPLLQDPRRGLQAVVVLAGMGAPGMTALAEHARSSNAWQRLHTALGLGRVRPAPSGAVDVLLGLAGDSDAAVRGAALRGLGHLGAGSEQAVPRLLRVLEAGSSRDREAALLALQLYGSAASNALPALERVGNDSADALHAEAQEAVRAIRGSTEAAAP